MSESIAEKYIAEITELYAVSEKNTDKMREGVDKINAALSDYYWDDVKHALQIFYTRHNDKSRPRLAQVLAILESDRGVSKREPDFVSTPSTNARPTTKLWSIKNTFDKMVDIFIDSGVLRDEDGERKNSCTLIDIRTNEIILNPWQWLKWQLSDALRDHPDCFVQFQFASQLEQMAVAIQNNLIQFKVRDWSKFTAQSRARANLAARAEA